MREFIKENATKLRYMTSVISVVAMIASITVITMNGLNWGLDFTGGVVSEVQLDKNVTPAQMHPVLDKAYHQKVEVISASEPGRWVLRYSDTPVNAKDHPDLKQVLQPISQKVDVLNTSIVGPQVGAELANQGGLALLISVLCILGYLSFRFEWRLASGALFALAHDVVFVLAFFAFSQMEFNLTVLAAILAILGYSLNDSIIIADRIRELLIAKPKGNITELNNQAVGATFSRTMVTSGTTLMTIVALWIMGGDALRGFSIAMFIGVLTGTWSSISVGTSLPEYLGLKPEHYKPKVISDHP
ncbi:protein translocase subunit SecF [Parashewanella tropica]|uniref:protein translocase subunit SecF n=1 Tax=Parashewanella tropica TaxID=2547970 RepID=UPI003CCC8B8B